MEDLRECQRKIFVLQDEITLYGKKSRYYYKMIRKIDNETRSQKSTQEIHDFARKNKKLRFALSKAALFCSYEHRKAVAQQ